MANASYHPEQHARQPDASIRMEGDGYDRGRWSVLDQRKGGEHHLGWKDDGQQPFRASQGQGGRTYSHPFPLYDTADVLREIYPKELI